MESIRLLDMGDVSPVRSQAVYHAVAHAMHVDTPDTIILVSPSLPYICIGFHQELEKEVDLNYCQKHGLPIVRREVGGGATYLDNNQVFMQWIFHHEHLPASIDERFALYAHPLVGTYQALGINAYYRPVNDIHVAGKKIGGTGAAEIGISEVVVGSFLFDFDKTVMAQVLKVSSEKMRDKIFSNLEQYMTTMREQLVDLPNRQQVKQLYLEKCTEVLQREIKLGEWGLDEEKQTLELEEMLISPDWLHTKGGIKRHGVKIHQDVRVVESTHKAPGGLIRVTFSLQADRIDDLIISGDFTILPSYSLSILEQSLIGLQLKKDPLITKIQQVYEEDGIQTPGVTPEDFAAAILEAAH
jgi:lipoate-protein ligase A